MEWLGPVVMFVALIVLVFTGFPLGFIIGGVGLFSGLVFWGTGCFHLFLIRFWSLVGAGDMPYVLSAAPLFIWMGLMLERSGVAGRLFDTMHLLMGPVRGGMAIGVVLIGTVLAACTGIIGASVVSIGVLAIPSMLKHGYQKELAVGAVMAGGTLGILIPPSIMLVLYGPMAQISVGKLFMAAIFPGLVLSSLYIIYILLRGVLNPGIAPALPPEERAKVPTLHKLRLAITSLVPPLVLIFLVLGTIFLGIAPPTEAAGLGALGAALMALAWGRMNWHVLYESCKELLAIGGMLCMVFAGASMFTGVFLGIGGGEVVTNFLLALPVGPYGILIVMLITVFLLGYFLDWIGIILIIVPIFTPLAAELGFDPLWFAMLVCVTLQMSFLTPPYAPAIFYLKGIVPKEVTMGCLMRGAMSFVGLQAIGVVVLFLFPSIALWLPSIMIK